MKILIKSLLFSCTLILVALLTRYVSAAKSELVQPHCSLQVSDDRPNYEKDGKERPVPISSKSKIFFVLTATGSSIKIEQAWNSTGYYQRSFMATDANGHSYTIQRTGGIWGMNFAATFTLLPGDVRVTEISLCDGTWLATPKFPAASDAPLDPIYHEFTLKLRGVFE